MCVYKGAKTKLLNFNKLVNHAHDWLSAENEDTKTNFSINPFRYVMCYFNFHK